MDPYTAAEFHVDGNNFKNALLCHYFDAGYRTLEIAMFLAVCHDVFISVRQLKRRLHQLNRRRRQESHFNDILDAFLHDLHDGNGQDLGYRSMVGRLRSTYHLNVHTRTVRILQQTFDPVGVENRRTSRFRRRSYTSRGPNYIIHIDGYDKLKGFGFAIHGAIDGFSRRVLWLTVGPSNNNPRIVADLYIKFIERLNGVPVIVRADRGTENVIVERLQKALRWFHNDSFSAERSFMYGRSTSNQRIESWWSQLRRKCTGGWINFFRDMRDQGSFDNSDPIHVECIRFCFTNVIRADLKRTAREWNQHRIRTQVNTECPSGVPDLLYFVPEAFDSMDFKRNLDFTPDEIQEVTDEYCLEYPRYGCAEWFIDLVEEITGPLNNYEMPTSAHEARSLFVDLLAAVVDV